MIAVGGALDQRALALLRERDPLVQRYRAFFAHLNWSVVPERDATRAWPGLSPQPTAAYVKVLLIKLCEHKEYVTQVRRFLGDHPLLVLEIGFRPVPDPTQPYGFDVERTLPGDRWLRHWQQHLNNALLHALLQPTVQALRAAIPGLGQTVAYDVKHSYAWVQQNDAKAYVPDRYNPARQPTSGVACRLGVKTSSNQVAADGTATRLAGQEGLSTGSSDAGSMAQPRISVPVLAWGVRCRGALAAVALTTRRLARSVQMGRCRRRPG